METKKSKYDTNPLDPDVERNAEEAWGDEGGGGGKTQPVRGTTRQVADQQPPPSQSESPRQNVYSEAPTRRYDNPPLEAPYPSVFIPPNYAPPPAPYQQQQQHPAYQGPISARPTKRTVAGIGIPEKWALMLPYAPYVGLVISLLELFLTPRREPRVRFHASQALALHIAFLVIGTLFSVIATVSGSDFGSVLFRVASTIFLIISMIRVVKGEPHRIAPLAEPTEWFNKHIEPRDQR